MSHPKVIGLAGIGLQVPELRVAEKFYGTFGLNAEKRGAGVGFRSTGGASDEILVLPGASQKRMHHLSFFIRPGDEQSFADKLQKMGMKVSTKPERPGLWCQDPWGTVTSRRPGRCPSTQETAPVT